MQMLVNFDIALSKYNEVTNVETADPADGAENVDTNLKTVD